MSADADPLGAVLPAQFGRNLIPCRLFFHQHNRNRVQRDCRSLSKGSDMNTVPEWHLAGDWFDICNCNIPCPCEFAQAPTNNACAGMLAWHVREGHYGDIRLDGLNLLALGAFEGNVWADEGKLRMGLFIDERADERQRQALQMVFGGQAGGGGRPFLPARSASSGALNSCR
jgi:hypothetical protein